MIRKIISIDNEKCNGCGLCVSACHEGAIGLVDGKAVLLRDDYCDGLGDCLPTCPTNAISFVEREAAAYDEAAVQANMAAKKAAQPVFSGCPGTRSISLKKDDAAASETPVPASSASQLTQWPVQLKLVAPNASYFDNANLLIAADCTAFAHGNFHNQFMKNKVTLIGCPKLDEGDYTEKLTAILSNNNIKSVSVVRMEVPCCGGIVTAVTNALRASGKMIPWSITTLSTDGTIIES